jgi:hypothetical protein
VSLVISALEHKMTDLLTRLISRDVWDLISDSIGLKNSQSLVLQLSLVSKYYSVWVFKCLRQILFDEGKYSLTDKRLNFILVKCPTIQHFEFHSCINLGEEGLTQIYKLPSLLSITFFNCSQINTTTYLNLFQNCVNLQSLELVGSKSGPQPKSIYYYLALIPKLKILKLTRSDMVTSSLELLSNLTNFEFNLSPSFNGFNPWIQKKEKIEILSSFSFPTMTNLTSLSLVLKHLPADVTDSNFKYDIFLDKLVNLENLVLNFSKNYRLVGNLPLSIINLKCTSFTLENDVSNMKELLISNLRSLHVIEFADYHWNVAEPRIHKYFLEHSSSKDLMKIKELVFYIYISTMREKNEAEMQLEKLFSSCKVTIKSHWISLNYLY